MNDKLSRRYLEDARHLARDRAVAKLRKRISTPAVGGPHDTKGLVVQAGGGTCLVEVEGETGIYRSLPGVTVGDHVGLSDGRVTRIFPRRTTLSRPSPGDERQERMLAANVDLVVIVASVGAPPLRPGLIDRCLIAAMRGGAGAIVCINKIDLLQVEEELDPVRGYPDSGFPVIRCSTLTGEGIDELAALLAGNVCVLAGHSGTGKSSLLNHLCPEAGAATGEVGAKGRHTTRSSSVHKLPNGARLIDTPGVRQFGLWNIAPDELRLYFPEFDSLAEHCRFRDCTHTHEPDCAVREAGLGRYRMYLRIRQSLSATM